MKRIARVSFEAFETCSKNSAQKFMRKLGLLYARCTQVLQVLCIFHRMPSRLTLFIAWIFIVFTQICSFNCSQRIRTFYFSLLQIITAMCWTHDKFHCLSESSRFFFHNSHSYDNFWRWHGNLDCWLNSIFSKIRPRARAIKTKNLFSGVECRTPLIVITPEKKYDNYLRVIRWCKTRGRKVHLVCWKMSRYQEVDQLDQNHVHI